MKELEVSIEEVLHFLGKGGDDAAFFDKVNVLIAEAKSLIRPRYVVNYYNTTDDGEIKVLGTDMVLRGKSIVNHLHSCRKIALIGATVGAEIERAIASKGYTDMAGALILDAAADAFCEKTADEAENEVKRKAESEGYEITSRFSPGYGDFDISIERTVLDELNAERTIGVTCGDSFVMRPRKSVTAFIGIGNNLNKCIAECGMCGKKDCAYRKETK